VRTEEREDLDGARSEPCAEASPAEAAHA
jgi:hypothetical protein